MENERWKNWCIPFVGRYVVENGKERFSWRLRDELKEALMNMDITMGSLKENPVTDVGLNTIFYGPPGTGKLITRLFTPLQSLKIRNGLR